MMKVDFLIEISGACRTNELTKMSTIIFMNKGFKIKFVSRILQYDIRGLNKEDVWGC